MVLNQTSTPLARQSSGRYTPIYQLLKMVSFKQIRDHLAHHGPQSDFYPISQVEFWPGYTPMRIVKD
jgi:hypothetical protein